MDIVFCAWSVSPVWSKMCPLCRLWGGFQTIHWQRRVFRNHGLGNCLSRILRHLFIIIIHELYAYIHIYVYIYIIYIYIIWLSCLFDQALYLRVSLEDAMWVCPLPRGVYNQIGKFQCRTMVINHGFFWYPWPAFHICFEFARWWLKLYLHNIHI